MRRFDKNLNMDKANLLAEQRYINENSLVRELEKEVGDGWDTKTVHQGDLELNKIGKELYSLFKKEGAKIYLWTRNNEIGEKEGFNVGIGIQDDYLEFYFRNVPNPEAMVNKYGPLILKSYPNLKLDNKSNDYFKLVTQE